MALTAAIAAKLIEGVGSDDLDPELREQLSDPDFLKDLAAHPGSKTAGIGGRLATAYVLRIAWFSTIDIFITGGLVCGLLGLAYLNVHLFAHAMGHAKMFTPFGSEWKMWRTVIGWPNFLMKYCEIILLILLDAIEFIIILLIGAVAYMLIWAATHPGDAFAWFGSAAISAFIK